MTISISEDCKLKDLKRAIDEELQPGAGDRFIDLVTESGAILKGQATIKELGLQDSARLAKPRSTIIATRHSLNPKP